MSKYEIKSVVCDYGVFEDNELRLICNSHANALKIKEILDTDSDMSKPYVWQDKAIADLEAKLAESETKLKQEKEYSKVCFYWKERYYKSLQEVKQQLAEKEKEITEYKRVCTIAHIEDLQVENMLLKGKDQDKISFCIEQLEKVKKFCENWKIIEPCFEYVIIKETSGIRCFPGLYEEIDDIIKQLKK